jgi:hypothetical protein
MGGATSASTSASALANSLGHHQQQQQQQLSMSLGGTNTNSSGLLNSNSTGIGIGSMAHRRSNTLTSVMSSERGQAAASSAGELPDDSNGCDDVRWTHFETAHYATVQCCC